MTGGDVVVSASKSAIPLEPLSPLGPPDPTIPKAAEMLGVSQRTMRRAIERGDPPWRYEVYSRETGLNKSAENHYSTMTLDRIKALEVEGFAADDCALFLWATAPTEPQAHEVMASWGFTYVTQWVWVKDQDEAAQTYVQRQKPRRVESDGQGGVPPSGR